MSKKRKSAPPAAHKDSTREEQGPTLKDMLSADVLHKLKQQADEMKAAEAKHKQEALEKAEAERKKEQKRLENDMAYLLDHYKTDSGKYK
ncbi:DUF3886 domain-containing protein [Paenibacillus sp. NEAU-GSW1]|nr:YqkE family protein [Paenibacillus sp. NEAU-GSW1]MUT68428.1 DUF3886 domain-containing protein [Paenibacillus sp. NEAU-GSW1]